MTCSIKIDFESALGKLAPFLTSWLPKDTGLLHIIHLNKKETHGYKPTTIPHLLLGNIANCNAAKQTLPKGTWQC